MKFRGLVSMVSDTFRCHGQFFISPPSPRSPAWSQISARKPNIEKKIKNQHHQRGCKRGRCSSCDVILILFTVMSVFLYFFLIALKCRVLESFNIDHRKKSISHLWLDIKGEGSGDFSINCKLTAAEQKKKWATHTETPEVPLTLFDWQVVLICYLFIYSSCI